MLEREAGFNINEIERDFSIKGPVEVVCQPKGFNSWCTLPYPGHPNGCPWYGKRVECPPFAPYFLDLYKPKVYIAFMRFDFRQYLDTKSYLHPGWTERALRNPRHFQEHLRWGLKNFVNSKLTEPDFENFPAEYNPEAMGVNIYLTARHAGIELEWPPRKNMYRVALLAQPK